MDKFFDSKKHMKKMFGKSKDRLNLIAERRYCMSRLPYSNNNCFENSCYGPRLGWSGAGWGVRDAGLEGGGLQA